jgi:hypothetical protein
MNKQDFEEMQKKFSIETKKRKLTKLLNFATIFISVLGISVLTYYFVASIFSEKHNVKEYRNSSIGKMDLDKRINEILESKENSIKFIDSNSNKRIVELEKKIEILNKIILDDPEKSLTIPLLRKDIDSQKINNDIKIETLKEKIETVIDLNKWVLGLIFSLLVTIVISNIFKLNSRKQIENAED